MCAEHTCLNAAVWTMCAEPDRCTNELCRSMLACDEHAELLAEMVARMLTEPPVIEEGEPGYGGHD